MGCGSSRSCLHKKLRRYVDKTWGKYRAIYWMIDPTMVSINDLTMFALLVRIVLGIGSMSASSSSDDDESTVRDHAKMGMCGTFNTKVIAMVDLSRSHIIILFVGKNTERRLMKKIGNFRRGNRPVLLDSPR